MSEDEEKRIFASNLNYYMNRAGKNQVDLIIDLGINKSTISTWCKGVKMPRMGTIQTLADYFGIRKSDLIEDHPTAADLPDVISIDAGRIVTDDLTEEQKEEVKRYVEWIKNRDKKE